MSATEDPIREQLIEARRNQILDAAASVFAEKGFHRATTKDIASAAGVSEGTIYNYFDSKADLLIGIMSRLVELQQLSGELTDGLQADAKDFFRAILGQRISRMPQSQEMIQAILPEVLVNPELRERFYQQFVLQLTTLLEQYVETRIKLGHMWRVDVPLTVRTIQGMLVGLFILRILGDETLLTRWEDLPEVVASLIFDGVRPKDGG
jgi:AcrR family transcriptional regulator